MHIPYTIHWKVTGLLEESKGDDMEQVGFAPSTLHVHVMRLYCWNTKTAPSVLFDHVTWDERDVTSYNCLVKDSEFFVFGLENFGRLIYA